MFLKVKNIRFKNILICAALMAAVVFSLCGCEKAYDVRQDEENESFSSGAETEQSAEGDTETTAEASGDEQENILQYLPDSFEYYSGSGYRRITLNINDDGTFTGGCHSSENVWELVGDTFYRVTEICAFSGKFSIPEKINEYTYGMTLESIEIEDAPAEYFTEAEDPSTLYIYSDPYDFLEVGDEFTIYLPGTPTQDLPEDFVWFPSIGVDMDMCSEFPTGLYALYNGKTGLAGFGEDYFWGNEYVYYYGEGYAEVDFSYTACSTLAFFDDTDKVSLEDASLVLRFAWENNSQTSFEAAEDIERPVYYYASELWEQEPEYEIDIVMSEDFQSVQVTIESLAGEDFSAYGGTEKGVLEAVFYLEE